MGMWGVGDRGSREEYGSINLRFKAGCLVSVAQFLLALKDINPLGYA
jgi:hypothetical protein